MLKDNLLVLNAEKKFNLFCIPLFTMNYVKNDEHLINQSGEFAFTICKISNLKDIIYLN